MTDSQLNTHGSVVEILSKLISIPSINPMGRDVTGDVYYESGMSDWLMNFFRSINAECERIEVVPGRDNVIARYTSPGAARTILLDAHQDTVPVDGMTIKPFQPQISNGRIFGRGSCDVKGGMAAMLFAFRRLLQHQPANASNVILTCTCDEESTTLGINDLVTYWSTPGKSQILASAPDVAVIAEPTQLDVVVAHRGVTRFKIGTTGRACHSSDPSQGVNAIYRMARVVAELETYAILLADRIVPHPLCGAATLSIGRIEGGTSVNVVPDQCLIEVDRRVIPGEDRDRVVADIREYLESKLGFDVQFQSPWIESPALTDADNMQLANAALRCVAKVDGQHTAIGVPYGTHASRTCGAGIPSIVIGPGSIDQAHTKDEFVEIRQLERAAEVYYQLCAGPEELWNPSW